MNNLRDKNRNTTEIQAAYLSTRKPVLKVVLEMSSFMIMLAIYNLLNLHIPTILYHVLYYFHTQKTMS